MAIRNALIHRILLLQRGALTQTILALIVAIGTTASCRSVVGAEKSQEADARPGVSTMASDKGWTREGELGPLPKHVSNSLPLSDQTDKRAWQSVPQFSDEFDGDDLDRDKWLPRHLSWRGRRPALFDERNVEVDHGHLRLTIRRNGKPPEEGKDGYHTYTSAIVQSRSKAHFGYYEVRAKPMDSAGSSSFWLADADRDWRTEIDVFELGGKGSGYETKFNMNLHVFYSPTDPKHRSFGAKWLAPYRFTDDFHVFALDWSPDEISYFVDGVPVRKIANRFWHQPLYLLFDSETMPDWFGLPDDEDLPSTYEIDYVRCWQSKNKQTATISAR